MTQDIKSYNEQGRRHGYWEIYHDNGQLYYKGNYVNDKAHGYCEVYHKNGQLHYKCVYVNGKEHGYKESYHDNGELIYKGNYVNGVRHGNFLLTMNKTIIKIKYVNSTACYKNRKIRTILAFILGLKIY